MKASLLTLIAMLALTTAAGAKSATPPAPPPKPVAPAGPQYFFNVSLDPRYQIVGIGPVAPEQAATANCYCFTYGSDGKLTRIEFDRAGTPMEDSFLHTARIDFEYAPNIERRLYRDGNGKPVANLYGVYGEELALDASGYPVSVTNLNDSGGNMRDNFDIVRIDRTLDGQSRLIRSRRTGLIGMFITDGSGHFETRTIYDSQSRPIERDNYDASGKPLNDSDGIASVHTAYTVLPEGNQVTQTYFDADGQAVDASSTGVHVRQVLMDPRGFQLSVAFFDASGQPDAETDSGVHERRTVYDERGNEISESFLGDDGQPANDRTVGFARIVYQYDDKNRVVEKRYFGDDGLPQIPPNVGAAMIRQEYDAQGNISRRQFFDGQGAPSNHAVYGVPAIRIKVEGDTTTVMLRDSKDHPAKNPINGYSSFSYKTQQDTQLSRHNHYYDIRGRSMSAFRVFVIRPHLQELRHHTGMRRKAHWGIVAAIIGALIAMGLAIRKTSFTKRRRIFVPSPFERFLGWFAVFTLIEGTICFLITIYWAWVNYQNGNMSWYVWAINVVIILFFAYRLPRMRRTMRVLNIARSDMDKLVRDFYAKAQLKPEYDPARSLYHTDSFSVRVAYFANKAHAYLKLRCRHTKGRDLMRGFAQYVRQQVPAMEAPLRSRAIALYYPCVALAYLLLAVVGLYIFVTMVTNN